MSDLDQAALDAIIEILMTEVAEELLDECKEPEPLHNSKRTVQMALEEFLEGRFRSQGMRTYLGTTPIEYVTAEERLFTTFWILRTGASFETAAEEFARSPETISLSFHAVILALCKVKYTIHGSSSQHEKALSTAPISLSLSGKEYNELISTERDRHLPMYWLPGHSTSGSPVDLTERTLVPLVRVATASPTLSKLGPTAKSASPLHSFPTIPAFCRPRTDESIADYDASNPQGPHFTQVLWKSSTKLGCAQTSCADGIIFTGYGDSPFIVCEYDPAGNVAGQYGDNVQV
ncbi:hypothetical protein L198_02025 [Cryptococcus wingfieldii CBS 7118]|uniref:SCP domain-containing protein n=1 Tax=Cryptococcus wingfieldii CBS 7118 TaxID=1295528 RepID=A0A1E3JZJ8_9TREE|nr:hypothetical protein L198_02025 [Cryptococcus wingfieldii CBS 7118]ODO05332.1 hypothetical protein L198_02025 [Cryptococcus wingfieldii CBS 7118]